MPKKCVCIADFKTRQNFGRRNFNLRVDREIYDRDLLFRQSSFLSLETESTEISDKSPAANPVLAETSVKMSWMNLKGGRLSRSSVSGRRTSRPNDLRVSSKSIDSKQSWNGKLKSFS